MKSRYILTSKSPFLPAIVSAISLIFLVLTIFSCYLPPAASSCLLKIKVQDEIGGVLTADSLFSFTLDPVNGTAGNTVDKDVAIGSSGSLFTVIRGYEAGSYELTVRLYDTADGKRLLESVTFPLDIIAGENNVGIDVSFEPYSEHYTIKAVQESELTSSGLKIYYFDAAFIQIFDRPAAANESGFILVSYFSDVDADYYEINYPSGGLIQKDDGTINDGTPTGFVYSSNDNFTYLNTGSGISEGIFSFRLEDTSTGCYRIRTESLQTHFTPNTDTVNFDFNDTGNHLADYGFTQNDEIQLYILVFSDFSDTWTSNEQIIFSQPFDVAAASGYVYIIALNLEAGRIPDTTDLGTALPVIDVQSITGYLISQQIGFNQISIYKTAYN